MNRRTMLQTGIAAALLASSSVARAVAENDPSIPSDWMIVDGTNNSVLDARTVAELKQSGVSGINYSKVGLTNDPLSDETMTLEVVDAFPKDLVLARTAADIRAAKRAGKIALVIGWQAADGVAGAPADDNPWLSKPPHSELRAHYELGLRICGICYNVPNMFGGGCLDPQVPLTRFGRLLIEQLHKLKILVDVGGHTGERTTLDVIAMSKGVPVICSHANVAAIADNPRNLSDRVIDAIAGSGGVIGITAINDMNARGSKDAAVLTTPIVGVDVMAEHCSYVRDRVGIDHVAFSSDFSQGEEEHVNPATSEIYPPEMASKQGPLNYVRGFTRPTELPNLVAALRKKGWPDADVRKFLGENWLRVYSEVWGA